MTSFSLIVATQSQSTLDAADFGPYLGAHRTHSAEDTADYIERFWRCPSDTVNYNHKADGTFDPGLSSYFGLWMWTDKVATYYPVATYGDVSLKRQRNRYTGATDPNNKIFCDIGLYAHQGPNPGSTPNHRLVMNQLAIAGHVINTRRPTSGATWTAAVKWLDAN